MKKWQWRITSAAIGKTKIICISSSSKWHTTWLVILLISRIISIFYNGLIRSVGHLQKNEKLPVFENSYILPNQYYAKIFYVTKKKNSLAIQRYHPQVSMMKITGAVWFQICGVFTFSDPMLLKWLRAKISFKLQLMLHCYTKAIRFIYIIKWKFRILSFEWYAYQWLSRWLNVTFYRSKIFGPQRTY